MFKKNISGGKDYEIGTLWGNHETLEWWQKRATEWHFLGTYKNGPLHADYRWTECTKYCLAIEDDMKDYIELKEKHINLNAWCDDLHAKYRGLQEDLKIAEDIEKGLKSIIEDMKKHLNNLSMENEDLRRRIDNYRGAQDINSKLADDRIVDMNVLNKENEELKQEISRLQRLNETGGKLSSSDGWPRVHLLEDENKSLYKQLEVMKNKYLMAYNLGLARKKRIEDLQEQNEQLKHSKIWNDSSRKQHDCNTNKELDNQYKLVGDLKSQLKQLNQSPQKKRSNKRANLITISNQQIKKREREQGEVKEKKVK